MESNWDFVNYKIHVICQHNEWSINGKYVGTKTKSVAVVNDRFDRNCKWNLCMSDATVNTYISSGSKLWCINFFYHIWYIYFSQSFYDHSSTELIVSDLVSRVSCWICWLLLFKIHSFLECPVVNWVLSISSYWTMMLKACWMYIILLVCSIFITNKLRH